MKKISDFDIIFISYDEPNAEENFLDLKMKFSNAKRVQGVKGFDASLRTACKLSETECFFVIDGDNKVTDDFKNLSLGDLNSDFVYSWSAKNVINSLVYGNGGIKLWPKKLLDQIDCHDTGKGNDWCYHIPYYQMNDWYSYSYCNATPFQAFRAGFREGVKLCLDSNGERFENLLGNIYQIFDGNLRRLVSWMSAGLDVTNGIYSIFGARLAFVKTICEKDFDINIVSDFDRIDEYWKGELSYVEEGNFLEHFSQMAMDIREITGLPVCDLDVNQSKCLKLLTFNPKRIGLMKPLVVENEQSVKNSFSKKSI